MKRSASASFGNEPHDLQRFVRKQKHDHPTALQELSDGHKQNCWSWWIFPTPPFIRNGRRVGSGINQIYELKDNEEGLAYLGHGDLRANYLAILGAMNSSLARGVTPRRLLGIDVARAEASVKYFVHCAHAAMEGGLSALVWPVLLLPPPPPSPPADSTSEPMSVCMASDA